MDSQPDRTSSIEQQLQEQLLEGVQGSVKQAGKIRDQLRETFEPYDFVTVINPFDHPTGWAYVDPGDEVVERPDKTTKRVQHGAPKTRILKVGERVVIHGWEAYIAIGRMFKEYAQEKGDGMTVVISSQIEIDKFIGKTFGGVFDPNQMLNSNVAGAQEAAQAIQAQQAAQPAAPAADPLGFDPEPTTPVAPAPQQPAAPVEPPANVGFDPAQPGGDVSTEQLVGSGQQVVGDSNRQDGNGNDENHEENA